MTRTGSPARELAGRLKLTTKISSDNSLDQRIGEEQDEGDHQAVDRQRLHEG
eukprot:CAMPEP_0115583482 /NCGR_PEP_ID=MMETSP0272-20121206/6196_1 /TAXON_ID=71861 /ORGANISM="Scrippsiella trochoidea, Strain CCMP3099" /LENGTH=51 /DNA_ID=CAMNT_0003018497 /DNA_START=51 /DNA_END=202 /DNA_ORIENTATION=+